MIRVVCGCGRVFKAEDRHTGKLTRCPVCGTLLTIGGAPASSSSGGDFDEVPSWWYPSVPEVPTEPGSTPEGIVGDPEARRTVVFPKSTDSIETNVLQNPPRIEIPVEDAGLRASTPSISRAGRLWGLSVGAGTLAVLALLSIWWIESNSSHGVREPSAAGVSPPRIRDRAQSPTSSGSLPGIPTQTASGATAAGDTASPAKESLPAVETGISPARRSRRLRLLVPAYVYPNPEGRKEWHKLTAVASKVDVVAIVNPNSGPGTEIDPDYTSLIVEARGCGVKFVGYVATDFGKRPAAEVKKDIDRWVRFYPGISGFFLDQQSCDAPYADTYADLAAYARQRLPDCLVITNPGATCDKTFLERRVSDVTCVFANDEGFGAFELPEVFKAYEPSRFAALAYKVRDVETMRAMVKEALLKGIGYIYITDDATEQPWERLPSYWEAEVEAVSRLQ